MLFQRNRRMRPMPSACKSPSGRNCSWSSRSSRSSSSINFFLHVNKGKVDHAPQHSIGGCSSPSSRPWACRWITTNVCDTWPVRRQIYDYLPSKASPPIGWYQIILLDLSVNMSMGCTREQGDSDSKLRAIDLKSSAQPLCHQATHSISSNIQFTLNKWRKKFQTQQLI